MDPNVWQGRQRLGNVSNYVVKSKFLNLNDKTENIHIIVWFEICFLKMQFHLEKNPVVY